MINDDLNTAYTRYYAGIYRGIVEDNNDPEGIGRCRVRVPSVHGALEYPVEILPWARAMSVQHNGHRKGSFDVPDIGDLVYVMFEGARKDYPIYLGSPYTTKDIPVSLNRVEFFTENGYIRITYDREQLIYDIRIKDTDIRVFKDHLEIKTKEYITLDAPEVLVKGTLKSDHPIIAPDFVKAPVSITPVEMIGDLPSPSMKSR